MLRGKSSGRIAAVQSLRPNVTDLLSFSANYLEQNALDPNYFCLMHPFQASLLRNYSLVVSEVVYFFAQ